LFRHRERAFKQFKCPRPQCVKKKSVEDAYKQTPRKDDDLWPGSFVMWQSSAHTVHTNIASTVRLGRSAADISALSTKTVRDNESHVTTDRLIQCRLHPHEVASQTSAYVNQKKERKKERKKKGADENLFRIDYICRYISVDSVACIFSICVTMFTT